MSKSYPSKYHTVIANVEETHFWFRARRDMILRVLRHFYPQVKRKTFLEVGFGTGELLSSIEKLGFRMSGVDINEKSRAYAKERSHATLYIQSFVKFVHAPFSAIGMFDVLEHQQDDMQFLHHAHALMKGNGLLFLTVPASPRLWSEMDRLSGHVRRYTKKEILQKLTNAGFQPLWSNYWNVFLFPFYAVWKAFGSIIGRSDPSYFVSIVHPVLNMILFYSITIENILTLRVPFLFGTSLVVVVRKKAIAS